MKPFGLFLIIIGLGIALIAVMNNHETDYDSLLRQNRERNTKSASEVRNMAQAVDSLGQMTGRKFAMRSSDSTEASLQESIANDTRELEERARARSSKFTTTLVVAGVFVVLGGTRKTHLASQPTAKRISAFKLRRLRFNLHRG
jgi:hypothetical protein